MGNILNKKEKNGSAHDSHEIDMLHGALLPKILMFCLPLALSGILQLLFNAADSVVLGRFVGPQALAAVGSTASLVNLLINLFIGLSVGVNVLVARNYAKNDGEEVSNIVHTAVTVALIGGVILIFVGWFLAEPMLVLMGSPDDVLPMSVLYIRIFFCGMPALLLYDSGAAILRAIGDTRRPLYYLMFAGVINVIFNLIFVIVFNMGVAGVALATSISNVISASLVLITLMRENSCLRFTPARMTVDGKVLRKIFSIGLPAGFQGIIFSFSNVLIQSSVNSFGSVVMAGSTAAANLEGFVYNAMNSVYQANLSFTSQNIGAGRYSRINRILYTCLFVVILIGAGMGLSFRFFGTQLLGIYSTDTEVIRAGLVRMSFICATYFLCGCMDVLVGSMRGMGYAVLPMIVSLIGACGFRILWIFTVFAGNHTMETLFISYPISWILTGVTHYICFCRIRRKFPREDQTN
ncbi:MAG: MATE family efflux transporter [Eubacteriales bacterium]|nr:MATE family efflux transporter [Eubacteriales bacterium]